MTSRKLPLSILVAALLAAVGGRPLAAQKTDTLVLVNGNRITGEIKRLERGKLEYSTDDMGTIYVEWNKIARLTSQHYFEVELDNGWKYYGNLPASGANRRLVVELTRADTLDMARVVIIVPIKQTFWSRIDGRVDLGFSYAKANKVVQLSLSGNAAYQARKDFSKLDWTAYFQNQKDATATSRSSLGLQFYRVVRPKWATGGSLTGETNEELNLDFRVSLSAGAARNVVHTNANTLLVVGSLVLNQEQFKGSSASTSLEVGLTTDYQAFRFDHPKLDLTANLSAFPSITEFGRMRILLNSQISYELISDFTVGFSIYDSFDSRGAEEEPANDFSTTFSIGYKY